MGRNSLTFDLGQALLGNSRFPREAGQVGGLVTALVRGFFVLSGITCVFLIIYAGYGYLSGAGNSQKIAQANQILTSGFIGLAIIFIAYWVTQAISTLTGVAIL